MRRICGMKVNNWLLHLGLIITVAISLVFTTIIWFNPATFQHDSKSSTATGDQLTTKTNKKLGDIYLPTQIVQNKEDLSYQLSSSKVDLVQKMRQQIKHWTPTSISQQSFKTDNDYQALLYQNNALVLNYGAAVNINLFNQAFGQKIKKFRTAKYNRILVLLGNKRWIYLMNDQKRQAYLIKFQSVSIQNFMNDLTSTNLLQLPVHYVLQSGQYQLSYNQTVKLPSYSYLINKASASSLVPQLLGSDNQSTITTKVQKNETIYADGEDNRMRINNQTGKIEFSSYSKENYYDGSQRLHVRRLSYDSRLKQSFLRISSLSNYLDNVRFAAYDPTDSEAIFRSFVAGFPIMTKNSYGTFKIQITNFSGQKYVFSIYSLQVQLPSSGQQVTLPATSQIYQQLLQAGLSANKIQQIEIGYQWQTNHSSKLVVDLVPTYFVKYNGQWNSYQAWISARTQTTQQ